MPLDGYDTRARWRRQNLMAYLSKQHAAFELARTAAEPLIEKFAKPGTLGRERVLAQIRQRLEPFEVRYHGRTLKPRPLAVFAYLKPRRPLLCEDIQPRPQLGVHCMILGNLPDTPARWVSGFWSVEVVEHALERAISDERSPIYMNWDETVWDLHTNILNASITAVAADIKAGYDHSLIPVGGKQGAFLCEFKIRETREGNGKIVACRAVTFLNYGQLRADQRMRLIPPATEPRDRLGSSWCMPVPLRKFNADSTVDVFSPAREIFQ